eukprot:TRINITY_DN64873_c0_g1_i1.p1 TRINITY_DN64873_c0_g1~~TRINITY_DN64873_c0_g1_i1.p1  ORF type:complete len:399 (+),score=36.34 TRINITY_DN64873_c0_g1_i1:44-1240(+)
MGNSIGDLVNEALSPVFDVTHGRVQLGLESSYSAASLPVTPLSLGNGLWLTGQVDNLDVRVSSVKALGLVLGIAQPVQAKAHGVVLRVSDSASKDQEHENKLHRSRRSALFSCPSTKVRDYLKCIELEVRDISLELCIAGSVSRIRLDAFSLHRPSITASSMCVSFLHKGTRFEFNDRKLGHIEDAKSTGKYVYANKHLEFAIEGKIAINASIDDVRAILDMAVWLQALTVSDLVEPTCDTESLVEFVRRLVVKVNDASVELDMMGEVLIRLIGKALQADVGQFESTVQLKPLVVNCGGGTPVSADVRVKALRGRVPEIQHGFVDGSGNSNVPWRSTVDLLLADPQFATHKYRLGWLRDGILVQATANSDGESKTPGQKRQRPGSECSGERAVKARLT